jgi:hypothetical protein
MDTTMELDDFKSAWQSLDRKLERDHGLQKRLFLELRLDKTRSSLRPLAFGQVMQMLLGIALIVLGVACWKRNVEVPGYLVSGILVHAFGVVNVAFAGITLCLIGSIDYAAPVLAIQKRLALLQRFYAFGAVICGLPWWIMWLLVVIAFAGLGSHSASVDANTPAWIWMTLAVCLLGLVGTWWFYRWSQRAGHPRLAKAMRDTVIGTSLRKAQAQLDELERFEKE